MSRPAFLFCLTVPLFAQQGPVNLNLEGWSGSQSPGYAVAVAADCRTAGSSCVAVRDLGGGAPASSGYVMQSFDATALRGKRIRFQAWTRVEAPSLSGAQLFVRVDRPSGVGFQEYGRRIRSRDWTSGEIAGRIDEDATRVTIGLLFRGLGSAHLADPAFEILDD